MKQIIINTQEELDKIKIVNADEELVISTAGLKLNCVIEIFGNLILKVNIDTSWSENRFFRANSSPRIEAWANSSPRIETWENSSPRIEAWANSSPRIETWENSSPRIEAWENSSPSIVARENSSPRIVARENSSPSIVARANSSPSIVAWANSSPRIEAWENSSPRIEARENSVIRGMQLSIKCTVELFSCATLIIPFNLVLKVKKSKSANIQRVKPITDWFDRNGIKKKKKIILYKKVSKDFKTQENTNNETVWVIGSALEHPNWNPSEEECGEGKYHACSHPYFCDDFRNQIGDKYIAIEIALEDLFEWKENCQYPHKIAFRKGKVLFECDRFGEKISKISEDK